MPSYANFLKEILGNKRKLEGCETVKLNEEYSAIIQRKLPPKLKDPRSFTIPCSIGSCTFNKVLCDLRANINLMPLSILQKLGLDEPKPTNVSFQEVCRRLILSGLLCLFLFWALGPFMASFEFGPRTLSFSFVLFIESLSHLVLVVLFYVYFAFNCYLLLNVILCSFRIMSCFYIYSCQVSFYLFNYVL